MANIDATMSKWAKVLDHESFSPIKDPVRRAATAQMLENTLIETAKAKGILSEADVPSNVSADFGGPNSNNTTNISSIDPIMMNMVRRIGPNNMAFDVCGVQSMTMPTGLVFAMRSKYIASAPDTNLLNNTEAFYNEADTGFSGASGSTHAGTNPAVLNDATPGTYTYGVGMATLDAEKLGSTQGNAWSEMGFTIEKISVTAKTRALKANYTVELEQDLRSVHGLSASSILTETLATEITAELNREVIRTIYVTAKTGALNTAVPGAFDFAVDSNGRWFVEKSKGLMFQIEREANQIAKETRRGRGNFLICSADAASALAMAGVLDVGMRLQNNIEVDDTGNTFAGVLNGKYKVYVDPYAVVPTVGDPNFVLVGYRGSNPMDAGLFYCPYVPLQLMHAIEPQTLQPVMGYKTRYGMVANPFAEGTAVGLGALTANSNVYFRRMQVRNLDGAAV